MARTAEDRVNCIDRIGRILSAGQFTKVSGRFESNVNYSETLRDVTVSIQLA